MTRPILQSAALVLISLMMVSCGENSTRCIDVSSTSDVPVRGSCFVEGIVETRPIPGVAYVKTSEGVLIGINVGREFNLKDGDKVVVSGKYLKVDDFVGITEIIEVRFVDE